MKKFSYGRAKKEDSLRISVLLKTVYIETYAKEGITFEITNFMNKRFSVEYIEKMIQENPDQFIIAYYDNNPIGAAEILFESNCPVTKKSIPELSKLYVLKHFNGKGVGFRLLSESEKILREKGFKEVYLITYIKNLRAISFYERQGFKKIGKTDFVMENNSYVNWVMSKEIS
jgi:Acetyltransferases